MTVVDSVGVILTVGGVGDCIGDCVGFTVGVIDSEEGVKDGINDGDGNLEGSTDGVCVNTNDRIASLSNFDIAVESVSFTEHAPNSSI